MELAIIYLLKEQGYNYVCGVDSEREPHEVLIKDDLRDFLFAKYAKGNICDSEVEGIIRRLEALSSGDLYESNKVISKSKEA